MTGRLRVGIVGVGWGALVLGPAFKAVPDGFELVALCGRTPERLARAAAKLGVDDVSTDWRSFVGRPDLDLIVVATSVDSHRAIALAAIAAGKHVYCEKPVAATAAEASEMLDAALAAGVHHACGFELRWKPERLPLYEALQAGKVGRPYFLRLAQSWDNWHPTHAPQAEWMYSLAAGGGYLNGMLTHDIDLACLLLGEPVAVAADVHSSVAEVLRADGSAIPVDADDTTTLLLRFANGSVATINCCVVAKGMASCAIDLYGSNGAVTSLAERRVDYTLRIAEPGDDGVRDLPASDLEPRSGALTGGRGSTNQIRATALMLEDWLETMNGGRGRLPVPSLRDGLNVQRIVDAARLSSGGAGWVKF